ncbi:ParB/RepB/Spo0J family partition protein [Alphaproteobacteria bacterium KMM 3653]|uniref:ParB/RepB/Spo0J family partition protein n=1 Tax=Harenicola maris TaxID=2841044 RepID=A0AAP2CQ02_9RHOB|nr:ParB/RepB/Spo0J family partition protein [Harenicola maris]
MAEKKRGLGRGLSALMADVAVQPVDEASETKVAGEAQLPIEQVYPNPDQPRVHFDEEALADLAKSIEAKGIIQPLIVRPLPSGGYQIVAGERRWRAAQIAKLHEVPVLIRELDDTEVFELAIIENIQRADLDPIEEARGYQQLIDRYGHTQEQVSSALGKSRSHIANLLRLLGLPASVQEMVQNKTLTAGHARTLVTADNPEELAKMIVAKGLSVRDAEKLGKEPSSKRKSPGGTGKDADTVALEREMTANLGVGVSINQTGSSGAGKMTLSYKNLDELDALLRVLSATPLDVSR